MCVAKNWLCSKKNLPQPLKQKLFKKRLHDYLQNSTLLGNILLPFTKKNSYNLPRIVLIFCIAIKLAIFRKRILEIVLDQETPSENTLHLLSFKSFCNIKLVSCCILDISEPKGIIN